MCEKLLLKVAFHPLSWKIKLNFSQHYVKNCCSESLSNLGPQERKRGFLGSIRSISGASQTPLSPKKIAPPLDQRSRRYTSKCKYVTACTMRPKKYSIALEFFNVSQYIFEITNKIHGYKNLQMCGVLIIEMILGSSCTGCLISIWTIL